MERSKFDDVVKNININHDGVVDSERDLDSEVDAIEDAFDNAYYGVGDEFVC